MNILRRTILFGLMIVSTHAGAQIELSVELVNPNIETFFVSSFDINSPAAGPVLFRIRIRNDFDGPRRVRLRLVVDSQNAGELARGSAIFEIPSGELNPPLTNHNLFSNSDPYRLTDFRLGDVSDAYLRDIYSTGRVPNDVLRFRADVEVLESNQQASDSDEFQIVITNPSTVDLTYPGAAATGSMANVTEIFSDSPLLRWRADTRRFRLTIAECRPGGSPEDDLQQEPRFVRHLVLAGEGFSPMGFEPIATTAFQYRKAAGDNLVLRPGKTYYWQVVGLIESSSGESEIKSEIFVFKIARPDAVNAGNPQYEIFLRQLLGNQYTELFGEQGEFYDYLPLRITMIEDGQEKQITIQELLRRIPRLKLGYSGQFTIEK